MAQWVLAAKLLGWGCGGPTPKDPVTSIESLEYDCITHTHTQCKFFKLNLAGVCVYVQNNGE